MDVSGGGEGWRDAFPSKGCRLVEYCNIIAGSIDYGDGRNEIKEKWWKTNHNKRLGIEI